MTMSVHEWWLLIAVVAAGAAVAGWLEGRHRLRRRYERYDGLMDQAYDEGWDDSKADQVIIARSGLEAEATPELVVPPPGAMARDWLTATHELLSPERIQDLPGPTPRQVADADGPSPTGRAGELHHFPGPVLGAPMLSTGRAGELHYLLDSYTGQFPAILHMGRPYDGDEVKTATRVELHAMTVRNRHEEQRRQLAAECGIEYVPTEWIAA